MDLLPRKNASRSGRRRLVRGPAVVALASGAVLAGSGAVPGVAQTPAPAGIAAPPAATQPDRPPYERLALETLDEVVKGEFAAVSARFDEALRPHASAEVLARSWTAYQQQFGSYVSHGTPRRVPSGDATVVNVPLHMEKKPGEFRVAFKGDGRIIGLFFLRTGVPVP